MLSPIDGNQFTPCHCTPKNLESANSPDAIDASARPTSPRMPGPQGFTVAEQVIGDYRLVNRGALKTEHPSFAQLRGRGKSSDLVVTGFEVFGPDTTTVHRQVSAALQRPGPSAEVMSNLQPWPNEACAVGPELLGRPGWLVANGFLVPGKGDGAITFIDDETHAATRLTKKSDGFFYHRVRPVHWGLNQSVALLTARAKQPFFRPARGELVLLTPRRDAQGTVSWDERVLATGPDVFFEAEDLDGDGVEELIAAQFFGKKLEIMWWDGGLLRRREIDKEVGTAFDVTLANLSGTQQRVLVLTTHEGGSRGGVYAYEIPEDFKHGHWDKHTLLTGIQTRGGFMNAASPGSPTVFYPGKAWGKPWIFVSGDDSQRGHLLVPKSQDPQDWSYSEHIILDSKSTIGRAAVGDIDGGGHPTLLIPVHDANAVAAIGVVPKGPKGGRPPR